MPMAAMSSARTPVWAMTSIITAYWEDQISMASCSTQPSWGKIWVNSFWDTPAMFCSRSKRMARELVVPWSRARR